MNDQFALLQLLQIINYIFEVEEDNVISEENYSWMCVIGYNLPQIRLNCIATFKESNNWT